MKRGTAGSAMVGVTVLFLCLAGGAAVAAQGAATGPGAPAGTPRPPGGPDATAGAAAHFELGEMYHRQVFEALNSAIKEYEEAIKLQNDHAQAHFNLGLAYHSKAKLESDDRALYRKALEEYQIYLKHNPNTELAAKAKQNMAAVEAMLGEPRGGTAEATKGARPNKKAPSGR